MKVSLGSGACPRQCGGSVTVEVDDGLDDKSTADTLRAKAMRLADAGGWRCSKCEYALPLTGDLLREIERIFADPVGRASAADVDALLDGLSREGS